MLKRLILIYEDGRKEDKIVHHKYDEEGKLLNKDETLINVKKDKIRHAASCTFKYRVKDHPTLPPALVNLNGKKYLMPEGIQVHPETTLDDVEVKVKRKNKKKTEENIHKFKSSSSDSVYTVREIAGQFKCNCPGFYRSRGNCKHVKELKNKKS